MQTMYSHLGRHLSSAIIRSMMQPIQIIKNKMMTRCFPFSYAQNALHLSNTTESFAVASFNSFLFRFPYLCEQKRAQMRQVFLSSNNTASMFYVGIVIGLKITCVRVNSIQMSWSGCTVGKKICVHGLFFSFLNVFLTAIFLDDSARDKPAATLKNERFQRDIQLLEATCQNKSAYLDLVEDSSQL